VWRSAVKRNEGHGGSGAEIGKRRYLVRRRGEHGVARRKINWLLSVATKMPPSPLLNGGLVSRCAKQTAHPALTSAPTSQNSRPSPSPNPTVLITPCRKTRRMVVTSPWARRADAHTRATYTALHCAHTHTHHTIIPA
jgi:hypothetical protein